MKHLKFKRSLIFTLILALVFSCAPFAFAETVGSWENTSSTSDTRANSRSVVINGSLYIIGGQVIINNESKPALSSMEQYNPKTKKWTLMKPMYSPRYSFQAEVVNNKIYVIGGFNNSQYLSSVEEYDPLTNVWKLKSSMPTPRLEFKTEVVNGKIYAMGGKNLDGYVSSLEAYDPETDTWSTLAPMPTARDYLQTKSIDNKIFVVGGRNQSAALSTTESYDVIKNEWSTLSSMSEPRMGFSLEKINGKLFAVGGGNSTGYVSSLEEYDPITNIWNTKSSMAVGRRYLQTEAANNKIYAIGGYSNSGISPITEVYDALSQNWTMLASMHNPRYVFQTEIVNNKIYSIGGATGNSTLNSVEEYSLPLDPTLTVTASPNDVKVGDQFTTSVAIHNVSNIFAEDISVNYDSNLFDYVGAEAVSGLKIYKEDKSTPGIVRFIVAHLGQENAANGDKDLINLTFKAKSPGTGKVDIIKGRIADNSTLEMDVSEENCGEDIITVEGVKDVNRSGEFTLLDLGIDAGYYGIDASQTDSTRFDTDVVVDGIINDADLAAVTESILTNGNYPLNN